MPFLNFGGVVDTPTVQSTVPHSRSVALRCGVAVHQMCTHFSVSCPVSYSTENHIVTIWSAENSIWHASFCLLSLVSCFKVLTLCTSWTYMVNALLLTSWLHVKPWLHLTTLLVCCIVYMLPRSSKCELPQGAVVISCDKVHGWPQHGCTVCILVVSVGSHKFQESSVVRYVHTLTLVKRLPFTSVWKPVFISDILAHLCIWPCCLWRHHVTKSMADHSMGAQSVYRSLRLVSECVTNSKKAVLLDAHLSADEAK